MRTLNDYFIVGKIHNISTAGSSFVVAPDSGKIIKIYTTIKNAITSANAGLSFELGGTAITDGGITIAHSGSAAGDIDTCEPTAANNVSEGDFIAIATDGASTNTHTAHFTIVIRR